MKPEFGVELEDKGLSQSNLQASFPCYSLLNAFGIPNKRHGSHPSNPTKPSSSTHSHPLT
jgi:hypothetical protein